MTIDWKKIASLDFEYDGGLRDIYIFGTDVADWNKVLDALRKFDPRPIYTEDNAVAELPDCVEKIFEKRAHLSTRLSFTVGKFLICCHFFGSKEDASRIEFDLSPDDMTCPDDLKAVAGFMHFLGDMTQKPVILTLESAPELPILKCQPNSDEVLWVSHNKGFFVSIPAITLPLDRAPQKSRIMKMSIKVSLETEDDQIRFQPLVPQITEAFHDYTKQLGLEDFRGSKGMSLLKMQLLDRARAAAPGIGVKDLWFDKIWEP
ncbi:MAG: hypothetical protein EPN97_16485 [Alphaproteobacteria bacterium]|nr:MAG: hypothetical protein EPN97_16485 [Alphaproteobacteria bacterium]